MVSYIRSDLDFILDQIKIAEAHALGQPLFGPNGLVPAYNLSLGLRTVDGSYNHLLPGQEQWGAAGNQFPSLMDPVYRPADGTLFDPDGPGPAPAMPTSATYDPSNNPNSLVFDSSLRTISNLLVDQTLGNPAAVLTALQDAGSANEMADLAAVTAIYQTFKPAWDAEYQARVVMQNAKIAADQLGDGDPLTPPTPAEQAALDALTAATAVHAGTVVDLEAARVVRDAALEPFGIAMQGDNVHLPNAAPDEGLSAPFNSWFTLFGQFFDHGLDLVNKGGSGTVFIPLQPDDPLYVEGSNTNFMVLTRATVSAGPDGIMGNADDVGPVNTTTSHVDQNQTYTSHPSHQVFLRQYVLNAAGDPVATGKLIEGANGGMATWGEVKAQASSMLGIDLTDNDVGSVPLLRTDAYGNFIPGANGLPQLITGIGPDGIPNTGDDAVLEGNLLTPVSTATALRTPHAFLADIAHEAVPVGKIADGDITIGLGNPGNGDTEYDNELLDAHFIAGDGRVNENIGLTAVHHVFHAEHNRLVDHTKEEVLATNDLAFINEWLEVDLLALPTTPEQVADLVWDGERLFQAAKFGTEMQYQHLVFEEFARKIQPNINVFVVPDGFDTTIDPSIVAEFAHVVYRFGHSMLTESIDRFDPAFAADHIGLIEGFLNPAQFDSNHAIDDDIAAGAIIRGMTRQVGNEIDEFVTTALRNNLLGLPLDLATINLARGRDTGVPSLNAARSQFYEATNQDILLKPYESWADFASHLKHEASIINFIAAYGTHETIVNATTIEEKRDAAMALVGLPATIVEVANVSNASFELDSLADGAPNVISTPIGNYTHGSPTGWEILGFGGLFAPSASVIDTTGLAGSNVVWLGQDGLLAKDTGLVLEQGVSYRLTFDVFDRLDLASQSGVARLVADDGTVLASADIGVAPVNGGSAEVMFQTAPIAAALVGQGLRIEIQQIGGNGNFVQILVDDVRLDVLRPGDTEAANISNASFDLDSLADGAPNVISTPIGNYTFTSPTGWEIVGAGGLFAPYAVVIDPTGLAGANVVWLGQDGLLGRDTGLVLEGGVSYRLTFDVFDRLDLASQSGVARLVADDGTVLASADIGVSPVNGASVEVMFQTAPIAAALVGQGLRIEIQQIGGNGTAVQILVDDVRLDVLRPGTPLDEQDRLDFLNATGAYTGGTLGGLNTVDLWIGGLAEEIMPFGGMLGSTFNFVFENQMQSLQNGDRFYYLQRLDGLHLFGEMENNSFAAMMMRNTNATHLPSDVFSTPGLILEVTQNLQRNDLNGDGVLETTDPVGTSLLTPLVIRNNPSTPGVDTNYLQYTGDEHVLLGGTEEADTLIASIGDDTLFGDGGNDRLEGGFGNDIINGGAGDDIITDSGGDDNIKAGEGNDVVHAGPGLDLVMGNTGQDFIFLGTDAGSEVFAGEGNDFIYGNKNAERILGNEGNDWIETGTFDGAPGDNFDEIYAQDGVAGHDVFLGDGGFDEFIAEGGDDIMVGSLGRGKMVGMSGFDWVTYKDNPFAVDADFTRGIVFDENPQPPQFGTQDGYEAVEGLSGSSHDDFLAGSDVTAAERLPFAQGGTEGFLGSALDAAGIARIVGLQDVLGAGVDAYSEGEIILGGDGSDTIMGRGGDDIIDGDKWLDVQIGVFAVGDTNHAGAPIALHDSMTSLANAMFNGTINPGQLSIVRTIRTDTTAGDIDTAVYQGNFDEYTFGFNADGTVTVNHSAPNALDDGVDTLRNIEQLNFLDTSVVVGTDAADTLNGTAGTGTPGTDIILGLGGDDTITASNAVNWMDGGAGNDTYRFTSAAAANGDTILGFEAGDRVDLTAIDANSADAIDQSFSLVTGDFTAAGQLAVTYNDAADVTVVQGNIDADADAEFTFEIVGNQTLTAGNTGL